MGESKTLIPSLDSYPRQLDKSPVLAGYDQISLWTKTVYKVAVMGIARVKVNYD